MTSLRIANAPLKDRLRNSVLAILDISQARTLGALIKANDYLFLLTDDEVLVSEDGIHFIGTGFDSLDKMNTIAYRNGIYVLAGDNGQIYSSTGPGPGPDFDWGWVEREPGTINGAYVGDFMGSVATATAIILVGTGAEIQRTLNGTVYTHITADAGIDDFYDVAAGNGVITAVGHFNDGDDRPAVQTSGDDGLTFIAQAFDGLAEPPQANNAGMTSIIFTDDVFIASGMTIIATDTKASFLQQSANGAAWSDISNKLLDSLVDVLPVGQIGSKINLHSHKGVLFFLSEQGDFQISEWDGSAFGNFERIPYLAFGRYVGITNVGDNYISAAQNVFGGRSSPYISLA